MSDFEEDFVLVEKEEIEAGSAPDAPAEPAADGAAAASAASDEDVFIPPEETDLDADFALALQLQEEEEARAARGSRGVPAAPQLFNEADAADGEAGDFTATPWVDPVHAAVFDQSVDDPSSERTLHMVLHESSFEAAQRAEYRHMDRKEVIMRNRPMRLPAEKRGGRRRRTKSGNSSSDDAPLDAPPAPATPLKDLVERRRSVKADKVSIFVARESAGTDERVMQVRAGELTLSRRSEIVNWARNKFHIKKNTSTAEVELRMRGSGDAVTHVEQGMHLLICKM